jgi:DNA mismatch repair protein MutL
VPRIRLLPDPLIGQIAAGEVVERPASVVKELIENALDAGASEISVELAAGGKRRITVTDDGCGMGRDDALLAFDRHATSKIASFEELERVGTLGFRGEALASIAAVARVELTTAESPGDGHRVRIEGGRIRTAEPASRPRGTTVEVASLFFNVPARRKFLKRPQTELRRVVEVVQGYALARPDVRFTLTHEERTVLEVFPGAGDPRVAGSSEPRERDPAAIRERIAQIFGRELARELVEIPWVSDRAGEVLGGFVGSPATTRGRRYFVFVNRRLVRDRAVLAVFYRSVRQTWRSDDFPALFLFLDLPPEEVDVNVHPQKSEVRFRDGGLLGRVEEALRAALERARGEEPAPLRSPERGPAAPFAWQGLGERSGEGEPWRVQRVPGEPGEPESGGPETLEPGESASRLATAAFAPLERAPVPLSGRTGGARPFRLLGQYKGTLILLEGPDGLYLVDQHVAHERILYERLRRDLAAADPPSQRLLDPPLLELATAEAMRLTELAAPLDACGFGVQPLSGHDLALTAVPAALTVDEAEQLLRTLASDEEASDAAENPEALKRRVLDDLAASLSCRAAVKMHHPLAAREMEALVADLFRAENPYQCPHGRPIVLQMTDADLERRFGRR